MWTDADVEEFNLYNKEAFYKEKNLGARADIWRVEILERFGGVYIDTDFECLNPHFFNFLSESYDFFTGLTPLDAFFYNENLVVANGIIGAAPNHPILKAYKEKLYEGLSKKAHTVIKGPGFFSRMILQYADKGGFRDIIFPASFFYPVGFMQMHLPPFVTIEKFERKLHSLKKHFCTTETSAIHWWEGSWIDAGIKK